MTSTIKVNNIQNQCGANIINENSDTITIGASGDTIALASGASQTGFGREGSVDWQTGSIKTTTFTAVSGEGYFVDTSSGGVTVNLPAGTAGAIVAFADYTRTFNSNNLIISPNGSNKIGGVAQNAKLEVNGQSATFVFVDATEGWINVQETQTSQTGAPPFITATGGTITTSGDCKIHTFTGPGTFAVSNLSCSPANNALGYLVVAGGGGSQNSSSSDASGGGGAGGFREGRNNPITPYTASPLVTTALTATVASFPITVGAGGSGLTKGSDSIFSTITSAGGGSGFVDNSPASIPASGSVPATTGTGGSGGSQRNAVGFAGNTPPVSPPQGNNGGDGLLVNYAPLNYFAGGGGGATAVGQDASPSGSGDGGAGATTHITGSPVAYAGGGGGSLSPVRPSGPTQPTTGGTGGGGNNCQSGTANTGGGSGGTRCADGGGGSGIVIIRYKFQ
jgi:hypothetical protein